MEIYIGFAIQNQLKSVIWDVFMMILNAKKAIAKYALTGKCEAKQFFPK